MCCVGSMHGGITRLELAPKPCQLLRLVIELLGQLHRQLVVHLWHAVVDLVGPTKVSQGPLPHRLVDERKPQIDEERAGPTAWAIKVVSEVEGGGLQALDVVQGSIVVAR